MCYVVGDFSPVVVHRHADSADELLDIRKAKPGNVLQLLDVRKVTVLPSPAENVCGTLWSNGFPDGLQEFVVSRIDVHLAGKDSLPDNRIGIAENIWKSGTIKTDGMMSHGPATCTAYRKT